MTSKRQETGQSKFAWTCLVLQIVFSLLFFLLVRYHPSADAANDANRLGHEHELESNLEKYSMIMDVQMMLFGGFGLLMTFLKRHGFSSVGLTLLILVFVTECSILLAGFTKLDSQFSIPLSFLDILEGGLASAAALITFGGVLGKLNPFQLLIMVMIETMVYTLNWHVGYHVLGAVDIGGAIFVHAFGAFFGVGVCFLQGRKMRGRSPSPPSSSANSLESSRYTSDLFAVIGTVLLWVFWPSFNAVLAEADAKHRAVINTYLSLIGSTMTTFIASVFMDKHKKLDMVDLQNASLSGGVAVGAIADLMIQPAGALIIGSIVGVISTVGFRRIKVLVLDKLGIHDTCGILYLHGIPGLVSGLLSILLCALASKETYGNSLYLMFPNEAPVANSDELKELQKYLPMIQAGTDRSQATQALHQLLALLITLILALSSGLLTGMVLSIESLFHPLSEDQHFNDVFFWELPEPENYSATVKYQTSKEEQTPREARDPPMSNTVAPH